MFTEAMNITITLESFLKNVSCYWSQYYDYHTLLSMVGQPGHVATLRAARAGKWFMTPSVAPKSKQIKKTFVVFSTLQWVAQRINNIHTKQTNVRRLDTYKRKKSFLTPHHFAAPASMPPRAVHPLATPLGSKESPFFQTQVYTYDDYTAVHARCKMLSSHSACMKQ